jgi:hypothetical protein
MKTISHLVEQRICYRKANPLQLVNNQIQAKYIELGDKAIIKNHLLCFLSANNTIIYLFRWKRSIPFDFHYIVC